MVIVAQLVEHWIVAPGVEGSIPSSNPTYLNFWLGCVDLC